MKPIICILFSVLLTSNIFAIETKKPASVTILTYNVENLFDAVHDEGKNDWQYLPLNYPGKNEACSAETNDHYRRGCLEGDWSQDKYEAKLSTIKDVVVRSTTKLADFLALVEVENERVVADLAKKIGYANYIITNSPDKRGIDVALLYNESANVKFIDSKEHTLHNKKGKLKKPTRNILEATFKIFGEKAFIYVNHWPSQGAPAATRLEVARQIKTIINLKKLFNRKAHFILTGDFNTVDTDYPHPFQEYLYKGLTQFVNVDQMFRDSKEVPRELKFSVPLGTYFYVRKMQWNTLDLFFATKGLFDGKGLEIDLASYDIITEGLTKVFEYTHADNYHFGTKVPGTPNRYNSKSGEGFSDHFPIKIELIKK